jgi:photosystem II stability/assembly factor-like uncharacterized protein
VSEPRRLRAALAVAAAGALVLAVALVYLHPMARGRPAPRTAAPVILPSPTLVRLQDFEVGDPNVAWACLAELPFGNGLVYATSDGGRTWRQLSFPSLEPADYDHKLGIQLLDARHAVLQVLGALYTTADGGLEWHAASLPQGQRFAPAAHFLSPSQGWYQDLTAYPDQAAQPTALWWTSDGGATWSERWRVDAQHPQSGGVPLDGTKYVLRFRDAATGWMEVFQGSASTLLTTSDGGRTWSPVDVPLRETGVFTDLELLPDGFAVLVARTGSGYVALPSPDRGRTWEEGRPVPITITPERGANRVSFTDRDRWATAGGSLVHVTSDAGRTWRTVHASLPSGIASLVDLWLTGSGVGWATGDDGSGNLRVLRTTDGGVHWSRSPVPYLTRS